METDAKTTTSPDLDLDDPETSNFDLDLSRHGNDCSEKESRESSTRRLIIPVRPSSGGQRLRRAEVAVAIATSVCLLLAGIFLTLSLRYQLHLSTSQRGADKEVGEQQKQQMGATTGSSLPSCTGNPCQNGGTCYNLTSLNYTYNGMPKAPYFCICPFPYYGRNCISYVNQTLRTPCGSTVWCYNGGVCRGDLGNERCQCPPIVTGIDCSEDVDECINNPCLNNATCKNYLGSYTCLCADASKRGKFCQRDFHDHCTEAPDITCARGKCINGTDGQPKCGACNPGFTGPGCSQDVDECASANNPCQNGGYCMNTFGSYSCACTAAYVGSAVCDKSVFCSGGTVGALRKPVPAIVDQDTYLAFGPITGFTYIYKQLNNHFLGFLYGNQSNIDYFSIEQKVAQVNFSPDETVSSLQVKFYYHNGSPGDLCSMTVITSEANTPDHVTSYGPYGACSAKPADIGCLIEVEITLPSRQLLFVNFDIALMAQNYFDFYYYCFSWQVV